MNTTIEAIIEDVVIEEDKIQPIIVNFQNGQLKDNETKKMKCGLYTDVQKNKTVLAISNGQIVYKGYRPDLSKELTYTMLAIHNKRTGKVRLIQAERWNVAPVLDEEIENNNEDEMDRIVSLNKQFGSKKVKRRTEQFEKMKINVDNVKEELEKTVSNIELQRSDLEPVAKDDFVEGLLLPPCKRDANHESDIYNIDDIVPKSILKTLYSQAVEIAECDIQEKPAFFLKTVEYAKTDPKSAIKIAMLLYIEAVLNWLNQPIKLAKKQDLTVCTYSPEVNAHVIETYSVKNIHGERQRPNSMRDKGIIHCIIMGLTIWSYKLDLELFSSMLTIRLGIKKLLELARWISAVPMKDDKKSVILKLPLPASVTKAHKKKKTDKKLN